MAAFTTQAPSGTMRPEHSAKGMNRSGRCSPSSGCSQRSSASAADDMSGYEVDDGLVVERELPCLQGLLDRSPEFGAVTDAVVHVGRVEAADAGAVALGGLQGQVGAVEQFGAPFVGRCGLARSR